MHRCTALILALVALLGVGCGRKPNPATNPDQVTPAPTAPTDGETTVASTADCAGASVKVLGLPAAGIPGHDRSGAVYAHLRAMGDDGRVWLNLSDAGGYLGAWFARGGAPFPLLLVSAGAGDAARLRAYRCAADPQGLQPVAWDGRDDLRARLARADDQEVRVVLADRSGHDLPVTYRYEDGQLTGHIPEELRARLSEAVPVGLAPDLRATARTLPEREPPDGGPLLVTAENGQILLERVQGVMAVAGVRQAGAPLPLLVVEIAGGGSMGMYYEAYLYDSARSHLVRVPWDQQSFAISTMGVEQAGDRLRTTGRGESPAGRRGVTILWQYHDGALRRVSTDLAPPPYPQAALDVLLLAFDTVSKRLPGETPRYFADPDLAHRFYASLAGQVPENGFPFCGECADRRLPMPGPVFVWTPDAQMSLPPSRLFAVKPDFQVGPLGPQITALTATPVTLAVPDAGTAVQVLRKQPELQKLNIPEPVFQGGFWTLQIPATGAWRVNPRTGEVAHSQ